MRTLLCLLLWALAALAQADTLRDPTQAPPLVASPAALATAPGAQLNVLVRNGVPYVVQGTRLVGVGQPLAGKTLVRITETEIWLREGKTLHKLPRFSGIRRSAAAPCGTARLAPSAVADTPCTAPQP